MYVTVIYMKLRTFVDPVVPVGVLCAGNFLENTLILRTCYASPAAPVGDFCTGSLLEKTLILRTYCDSPAAPVGDFCTESSAAPLGDFCAECRTRGYSVLPLTVTSVWSNAEDHRCGLFRHWLSFLWGIFCLYITWRRLIKNLTPLGGKECGPE
jgi:hypothetical protein